MAQTGGRRRRGSSSKTASSVPAFGPDDLVRPREAASGDYEGEMFVLNPNDLYRGSDVLVREYPHLFVAADRTRPAVEQATAAPGELR